MKTWHFTVYLVAYFILAFVAAGVVWYRQSHPLFPRGACLQGDWVREDWEEPASIWKIQGVGLNSFRVSLRHDDGTWSNYPESISYVSQGIYKKVKCP